MIFGTPKALMRFNKRTFGIYEEHVTNTLNCLAFPEFLPRRPELDGRLCYFLKPYPRNGFSICYSHTGEHLVVKILDLEAHDIAPEDMPGADKKFFDQNIQQILSYCHFLKIPSCQLFFTHDSGIYRLTDVYYNNKFVGPGMINDIFGKQFTVPELIEIKLCDQDTTFQNAIIKPSIFRTIQYQEKTIPLYVKV